MDKISDSVKKILHSLLNLLETQSVKLICGNYLIFCNQFRDLTLLSFTIQQYIFFKLNQLFSTVQLRIKTNLP